MTRPTATNPTRRAGFSLIEILVVVSIVTILIATVAIAGSKMKTAAKIKRTKIMLSSAMGVATEYELTPKKRIDNLSNFPIDWTTAKAKNAAGGSAVLGNNLAADSSEQFCWAAWQFESTQKMLLTLRENTSDPSFIAERGLTDKDGNGFYELRDDWGNKVIYSSSATDLFVRDHLTPFFVSAGPDGDFGDVRSTATAAQKAAALDNIYSDDPE